MDLNKYMELAVEEARLSLREGNKGFGAVIIKAGKIVASTHDRECTEGDPTSHAELNVIREAVGKLGRSLTGCTLVSTHEPCPMCTAAAVWSGISEIAYGYSIEKAIDQGRNRIGITSKELIVRSGADIKLHENIMEYECSVLYRKDVRAEIEKLRNVNDAVLDELNADSACRRIRWFEENRDKFGFIDEDILGSGYRLLLKRFNITQAEAAVVKKTDRQIVFHSRNFCPTLEACKILGLNTRIICRRLNENSTDALIKQIDTRLGFSRNYEMLRPYAEYCEEMISIEEK